MWKTILRSPRPPSVRWEKQRSESAVANTANARKDSKEETKSKDASKVHKVVQVQPRFIRQSPLEMHAAAQAKVQRLQAALSVLGDADAVEKENLERALSRAQTQAVVPPVSAQITSTKGFIEREKKRLAAAEEAVIAAVQNRDECIKALAEGERRLEELQLQEKSFVAPVPDSEAELVRLRASGRAPRIGERSPETHEAEDLSSGGHARVDSSRVVSLDRRPSGGRAGSSHPRDHNRVIELSSMLTKGAERMVEMTRLDISDDKFRSRAAPGEGCFAPY